MRTVLRSPPIVFLALVAVVVGYWNVYVVLNDDGILEGRVVFPNGAPAGGAKVVALSQKIVGLEEIASATSNGAGWFRFTKHNEYRPILQARKTDFGQSDRVMVRLYFRNQNRVMSDPLVLQPY